MKLISKRAGRLKSSKFKKGRLFANIFTVGKIAHETVLRDGQVVGETACENDDHNDPAAEIESERIFKRRI